MVPAGGAAEKRLDGWKSIAAHFNRDRTTVMRWARERNLPVRRIPGGKQGSVFAFEHELAAWALSQADLAAADPVDLPPPPQPEAPPPPPPAQPRSSRWRLLALAGGLALVLIVAVTLAFTRAPTRASGITMPRDAAVARDYVAARDAWGRRTPESLQTAVRLYESVIRRDPGFAPAYSGLAETWLLLREYGDVNEPTAYGRARRYAEKALKLDPELPGGHRALGFIDYWWSSRTQSAVTRFEHAVALDGRDPLTHFWFANILADLGDDARAQREYDQARLLAPGSQVIEIEQACSHWQAGRDALALEQLTALARRAPEDATIQNCLAWVHISRGNIVGFSQALTERARLRREPQLTRFAAEVAEAVRQDPNNAVRLLVAEGRREIAEGERQLRETPAFYASAMGDRAALVRLLREANDIGERWPSVPVTRRIKARWRSDAEVQRLLDGVMPPAAPR